MAAKTDMERLGVFKELGYTTIGDVYKPSYNRPFNAGAGKGRQMIPGGSKAKCGNQAGYFDSKFNRVMEGEAYNDIVKTRRKDRIQQSKKNIGKAWVPSSESKFPSGSGSLYGCFTNRVDAFSAVTKPKDKYKSPGRNFFTNPGKCGTGYGYLNITIGKYHKYQSEPYNRSEEIRNKEMSGEIKGRMGGVFKLSAQGKDYFDENPYRAKKPQPSRKDTSSGTRKSKSKPFVPSSPSKLTGGCKAGTFTRYPEHSVDGYIPLSQILNKKSNKKLIGGIFKPTPHPKSRPTRSVIAQSIDRSINRSNFLTATA